MKLTHHLPLTLAAAGMTALASLQAAPETAAAATSDSPKASISADELAKTKNVPVSVKNPQGDFSLVAVVEGIEANSKLSQSLQIVSAQRQRLSQLSTQFEQTSPELPQQRELLATQINELTKALKTNLRFMSQNFAYSLSYNYTIIPHEATLMLITEKEGKVNSTLSYEFKNADSYDDCQTKRIAYFTLKQEQAAAASKDGKDIKDLKPTAAMSKARSELIKLYKYDPDKKYQINLKKTAIYARPAK